MVVSKKKFSLALIDFFTIIKKLNQINLDLIIGRMYQ
jgi:hypothetical protein